MGSHLGASWKSDVASLISSTLAAGSGITVTTSAGTVTIAANASAAYTRTSFTATAGQTTFSSTYTVGTLQVYVNGVLLNAADYTASNGTSVVLATACAVNDIVELVAFNAVGSSVMAPANGGTGVNNGNATLTMGGSVTHSGAFTQTFVATGNSNVTLPTSGTLLSSTALSPYSHAGLFGTGVDGARTLTTTITLGRDMHYTNLTISGAGKINLGNFRLFVSGILDLSNAGANALNTIGAAGGAASGPTAGTAGTSAQSGVNGTLPRTINGGAGANGTTGVGAVGVVGNGSAVNLVGGGAGAGGAGGAGTNAGGAAQAPTVSTNPSFYFSTPTLFFATNNPDAVIPVASQCGNGGSSGGGDGANNGGGGGAGGGGAQAVAIYARFIARGTNTTAGIINASGAAGGLGGSGTIGTVGGGGGGSGGAGSMVYIVCEALTGSVIPNAIDVSGGNGGAGGAGFGSGLGGTGGYGANAGNVQMIVLSQAGAGVSPTIVNGGTISAYGYNCTALNSAGTAGGTTVSTAGGAAGTGAILKVGL